MSSKPKKLRKLIKSAKMGKPYAMYRLGLCYEQGLWVKEDFDLAVDWIEAAAIAGCKPAIEWMEDYRFDDSPLVQAYS